MTSLGRADRVQLNSKRCAFYAELRPSPAPHWRPSSQPPSGTPCALPPGCQGGVGACVAPRTPAEEAAGALAFGDPRRLRQSRGDTQSRSHTTTTPAMSPAAAPPAGPQPGPGCCRGRSQAVPVLHVLCLLMLCTLLLLFSADDLFKDLYILRK